MNYTLFTRNLILAMSLSWKSKIHITMSYFLAALILIVFLVVEFSARQLATVSLDVGISIIRLSFPLLVVILAQEMFSREFDKKLYLTSLTFPSSRTTWFLARVSTIFLVCLTFYIISALVLVVISMYVGSTYQQATPVGFGLPYFITMLFGAVDLLVVVVIASFLAMSATTPSFVLIGTIGFTIIARSYTPIIELLRGNPYTVAEHVDPQLYQDSLGLIAYILPDLGRLDVRMIALYDKMIFLPSDWFFLLAATLTYAVAVLGLAAWVLNKREFN